MKTIQLSQRFVFLSFLLSLITHPVFAESLAPAVSTSEAVGRFLTTPEVAGFLLVAGSVFLFLSILTMGTGAAEVASLVCFGALFSGRYLVGEELWIPLGLFALGMAFASVEVFLIPGFGVFGAMSALSFGGLSVLVMESPKAGITIFMLSSVLSVGLGIAFVKLMPHLCVTRKLFILPPPEPTRDSPKLPVKPLVVVGNVGETCTQLRPIGTVLFGTDRVEVVSEGEFLQKGETVEVVRVEGNKVVVRGCSSS